MADCKLLQLRLVRRRRIVNDEYGRLPAYYSHWESLDHMLKETWDWFHDETAPFVIQAEGRDPDWVSGFRIPVDLDRKIELNQDFDETTSGVVTADRLSSFVQRIDGLNQEIADTVQRFRVSPEAKSEFPGEDSPKIAELDDTHHEAMLSELGTVRQR